MKLASYRYRNRESYGLVEDANIVDLPTLAGERWSSLAALLRDENGLASLSGVRRNDAASLPLAEVEMLPPIVRPEKVICIGLNYKTHIAETGRETPVYPMLFARFADSLAGHGQAMMRPRASSKYDFEGELAVIIGRTARHVAAADARDYVAGYSCFNDGSLRDYQRRTMQFLAGKTFWHSGAFGPWLVTPDEVGDLNRLTLTTRLNGEVMQHAEVSDLLFGVADLIAYISAITPLNPGDVIATGTTSGIGAARKPPVWMAPGDKVEVDISRIGVLANEIVDEADVRQHTGERATTTS